MSKGIKAPVMRKNQPYVDWKKELQIWEATNQVLGVNKKIQGGILYKSLYGIQREIVLSELSVTKITSDDGVANIIKVLDKFFYQ